MLNSMAHGMRKTLSRCVISVTWFERGLHAVVLASDVLEEVAAARRSLLKPSWMISHEKSPELSVWFVRELTFSLTVVSVSSRMYLNHTQMFVTMRCASPK